MNTNDFYFDQKSRKKKGESDAFKTGKARVLGKKSRFLQKKMSVGRSCSE